MTKIWYWSSSFIQSLLFIFVISDSGDRGYFY